MSHCWRYDINIRLGKFLQRLRLSEKVDRFLYEEAKALLQNSLLDEEEAVHLCATKKQVLKHSLGKLKPMPGDEYAYFRVDFRSQGEVYTNTFADEFAEA